MQNTINYIGKVKGTDKINFYNSIDAFILPAISLPADQDGIPVVLMEAISYGKPIISTNVSGIPEICKNEFNGYLIPEKDTNSIVKSIVSIYNNETLRLRFANNSLKLGCQYNILVNSKSKLKLLEWQEGVNALHK